MGRTLNFHVVAEGSGKPEFRNCYCIQHIPGKTVGTTAVAASLASLVSIFPLPMGQGTKDPQPTIGHAFQKDFLVLCTAFQRVKETLRNCWGRYMRCHCSPNSLSKGWGLVLPSPPCPEMPWPRLISLCFLRSQDSDFLSSLLPRYAAVWIVAGAQRSSSFQENQWFSL